MGRGAGPTVGSDPVIHAGVVAPRPRPAVRLAAARGLPPVAARAAGASLGGAATGRGAGPTAGASLGGGAPLG